MVEVYQDKPEMSPSCPQLMLCAKDVRVRRSRSNRKLTTCALVLLSYKSWPELTLTTLSVISSFFISLQLN